MTALLSAIGYGSWILHALIWLPVLGVVAVMWFDEERAKHIAFWWSVALLVLSLGLWWAFDPSEGGMQMASSTPWIGAWSTRTRAAPMRYSSTRFQLAS